MNLNTANIANIADLANTANTANGANILYFYVRPSFLLECFIRF